MVWSGDRACPGYIALDARADHVIEGSGSYPGWLRKVSYQRYKSVLLHQSHQQFAASPVAYREHGAVVATEQVRKVLADFDATPWAPGTGVLELC